MGQRCPVKCISFLFKAENTALQWALKSHTAPVIEETWHLRWGMLKVKDKVLWT